MLKQIMLCGLGLFLAGAEPVQAHQVTFKTVQNYPAVIVRAGYEGAEPLSWAAVSVFPPDQEHSAWQNGRADKAGQFAFVPNAPGFWTVHVDDEMGHKAKTVIEIAESFFDNRERSIGSGEKDSAGSLGTQPLIFRLLFGLMIIFGVTGIAYGLMARQSLKKG
ncbi:MAG TPA: hypothetical protein ENN03_06055 [bacterium]|nr:hypothetical protein [bacterium]